MCARQHKWGSLLPNREDTDGVRRPPPSKGVGAPHQCSRVNEQRSGWEESSLARESSNVWARRWRCKVVNFFWLISAANVRNCFDSPLDTNANSCSSIDLHHTYIYIKDRMEKSIDIRWAVDIRSQEGGKGRIKLENKNQICNSKGYGTIVAPERTRRRTRGWSGLFSRGRLSPSRCSPPPAAKQP